MLSAFFGGTVTRDRLIFWEWRSNSHGDNLPRLAVRDGDWKLVAALTK